MTLVCCFFTAFVDRIVAAVQSLSEFESAFCSDRSLPFPAVAIPPLLLVVGFLSTVRVLLLLLDRSSASIDRYHRLLTQLILSKCKRVVSGTEATCKT